MGAVWAALLFVLVMTDPRLTGFAELIPLLMLDLGQWLVVGGAVLFAWGYSRWKLSRQPAPVQNLEALLFRQHQSDTLRSVITSPAALSVVLLSVGFAGMIAGHQETAQRFAFLPSALLDGERLWTLITSIFLHGDLLYLASNLLGLLLFGVVIDLRLGHLRTALIMLGCGITAGIAHSLFTPEPQQLLIGTSRSRIRPPGRKSHPRADAKNSDLSDGDAPADSHLRDRLALRDGIYRRGRPDA